MRLNFMLNLKKLRDGLSLQNAYRSCKYRIRKLCSRINCFLFWLLRRKKTHQKKKILSDDRDFLRSFNEVISII